MRHVPVPSRMLNFKMNLFSAHSTFDPSPDQRGLRDLKVGVYYYQLVQGIWGILQTRIVHACTFGGDFEFESACAHA